MRCRASTQDATVNYLCGRVIPEDLLSILKIKCRVGIAHRQILGIARFGRGLTPPLLLEIIWLRRGGGYRKSLEAMREKLPHKN